MTKINLNCLANVGMYKGEEKLLRPDIIFKKKLGFFLVLIVNGLSYSSFHDEVTTYDYQVKNLIYNAFQV